MKKQKALPVALTVLCQRLLSAEMPVDGFRHCSNTDKTCADRQQLHRRQEFCGDRSDTSAERRPS